MMPTISIDCLLVRITHAEANAVPIAKILKQIWVRRTIFWVFAGGLCGNLSAMIFILRYLRKVVEDTVKAEQEQGREKQRQRCAEAEKNDSEKEREVFGSIYRSDVWNLSGPQ